MPLGRRTNIRKKVNGIFIPVRIRLVPSKSLISLCTREVNIKNRNTSTQFGSATSIRLSIVTFLYFLEKSPE